MNNMKFLYVFAGILVLGILPAVVNFIAGSSILTVITLIGLGYICYLVATSPARAFGGTPVIPVEETRLETPRYCHNHKGFQRNFHQHYDSSH